MGPIKNACRQNGCIPYESEAYVERKVREGLAAGQQQALSAPARINGKSNAGKPQWRDWSGNNPKATFQNTKLALQKMGISPRRDIFHGRLTDRQRRWHRTRHMFADWKRH